MNFLPLWRYQNQLIDGAIVTLELTVIAAVIGRVLLIGYIAGAVCAERLEHHAAALASARGYIDCSATRLADPDLHRLLRAA